MCTYLFVYGSHNQGRIQDFEKRGFICIKVCAVRYAVYFLIFLEYPSVLSKKMIAGNICSMLSMYCGAVPYKQGTNYENIRKQIQISWNIVPQNPN